MEIKGLSGFVRRNTALEAGEGADPTTKYARIRVGPSRARSVVVATDINMTGEDPAALEAEIRERLEGIDGDHGDKVWIEALRRGGSSVLDSVAGVLDADAAPVAIKNAGEGIGAMAAALVAMAASADDRATRAQESFLASVPQYVEARVAASTASILLDASERSASEAAMSKAVDAIIPLLPAIAARLVQPAAAPAPAPAEGEKGEGEKVTIQAAAEALGAALGAATDEELAEAGPAMIALVGALPPGVKAALHSMTAS